MAKCIEAISSGRGIRISASRRAEPESPFLKMPNFLAKLYAMLAPGGELAGTSAHTVAGCDAPLNANQ